MFSSSAQNLSQPIRSQSLSLLLDVIAELTLERWSDDQWSDVDFIGMKFGQNLKLFLPYASSTLLSCVSGKNLSCQTFQQLVQQFNLQLHMMNETQRRTLVDVFILPFLRRNTTNGSCTFTSSNNTEWILKNFGQFVELVSLRDLFFIHPLFDPLETLVYLSRVQKVDLMVDDLPGLPEKNEIINKVFDHLLESPVERRLPEVLEYLLVRLRTTFIPCSSYTLILKRLVQTTSSLPVEMANLVLHATKDLQENGSRGCEPPQPPEPPTCLFTSVNATRVCEGVTSFNISDSVSCDINVEQYACSPLSGFTSEKLANLLTCHLSSNSSTFSKEIWKLLFTKTNESLDQALIMFSSSAQNLSQPIRSQSLSLLLDVIAELTLERWSDDQWSDVDFIGMKFGQNLKLFLPYASSTLLSCVSGKNLSCQTFQQLVQQFNLQLHMMNETQRRTLVDVFILPFLRRNTTNGSCTFTSSNNTEWILKNFGQFVELVSLRDLFFIHPLFDPLETLVYLSRVQKVDLMVDDLPGLPEKNEIINKVFDHLLESPVERRLPEVLEYLLVRLRTTFIPCSSYTLILKRLVQTTSSLPVEMANLVLHATKDLQENGSRGCEPPQPPEPPTCLFTSVNATRVCEGVTSFNISDSVSCDINVEQYACSPLSGFTSEKLANLLTCHLSSNSSTFSKEIWKLLFTKTNESLDQALIMFSSSAQNLSQPIRSQSLSLLLDVIAELTLERWSDDQWSDVDFIGMKFGQNLKLFLPYASSTLLSCVSGKNLSCQTFQQLVQQFNLQLHMMNETQRRTLVDVFILPFLRRNTTNGSCTFTSSNNTEWILKNFGQFVELVSLRDLFFIHPLFDPLETLVYLSPVQKVDLMVDDLPGLPEKNEIINKVFDHLLESPVERHLPKVLQRLFASSFVNPLSCKSNQIIFRKLEQVLRTSAGDLESIIWISLYKFNSTAPAGCSLLPSVDECPLIPFNEAQVCSGVDSSSLQQHLKTADATSKFCDFSVQQYACTPMLNVSVDNLVSVLECQSSADVVSSPGSWKLFLIRVSHVLDSALHTLSNTSMWWSAQSGSVILDVLRELRLDRLTDDGVIAEQFGERLRPFLPLASRTFLQCLSVKNFSCQNFQRVVSVFDAGFLRMNDVQQQMTVKEFILPIIQRQTRESACVSSNSSLWISSNLGQFSSLLTLDQLITLNPQLNLLETLVYLSPVQLVSLMVNDVPGLPEKAVVIEKVFEHLSVYPLKIPDFLHNLIVMSETSNMSCDSYRVIFHRLDHLLISVSVSLETLILRKRTALLKSVPLGCLIYSGECDITPVNETEACNNVNSSAVSVYLSSSPDRSHLCDYSIAQYSCAQLTDLTSEDLKTVLSCGFRGNDSVSDETLKLFVQKVNPVLGLALDQLNVTLNKSRLSVSFLKMIGEVTLSTFSSSSLTDDSFVQRWFNDRLRPFLPHSSEAFLSCLTTRDFSCDTYRTVVNSFSQTSELMSPDTQENVYVDFINIFLSLNNTAGCVTGTKNSSDWLIKNFGDFRVFSTISGLQTLNPSFSVMDTFSLMTIRQLVEVSSTPGLLSTSADVNQLLSNIPTNQLTEFYKPLSLSLQSQDMPLSPAVREEFLQQVFVRVNLTSASDVDLQLWIQNILPPFITNISVQHVTSYFSVLQGRPCSLSQQGVELLNSSSSSFTAATQDEIYRQILNSLQGSGSLRCYGNQSYLSFLQSSFMGFQFPNLSLFLSLMPPARVPELMSSMSPAEISIILNRPNAVDDVTKVCQLLYAYPKTPQYLQREPVGSEFLGRQVLSCVWPQVLRVENRSEVDRWFDQRLVRYLPFLTAQLVDPDVTRNASCLSFSKFVSVMSSYNFSAVGFSPRDIYSNIQIYLNTTSTPKCYDPSHPELNSTAWFANYIYTFMSFITLDDLTLLYGSSQLQPFTVNLDNLKLFDLLSVPDNVTEFYITLLFKQDPSFSAFYLPMKFRCLAPPTSFSNLSMEQLKIVSPRVNQNCSNIPPDVSAALSSNPQVLSVESITVLGQSCIGLSTTQLSGAGGRVLRDSLSVLSSVIGWNQDQAMTIIQSLLSSGLYMMNSTSSLQAVGSLILGVSSSMIVSISGNELLASLQSASFVTHVSSAPVIVQQTMVNQIIAISSSSDFIVNNVPAVMATEIPRIYLVNLSPAAVESINLKTWKHEQAIMLFEIVAARISDADNISFQVLQGFTCTRVQNFSTLQINNLIRGCRQRDNTTIILQESQLTCMYYYIKSSNPHSFTQYPADVLLYYNYSLVQSSQCRSYFSALGNAKFSVLSSMLSFKQQTLFNNARDCLGISGLHISREQLDVMGSMCCILSADYIQNSDPHVLEKLKKCPDLSQQQISAVETLLLSGNTSYGSSESWNIKTLENLGSLPLYFSSNVWNKIPKEDKQRFLKAFIRGLRKKNIVFEIKFLKMTKESSKSSKVKRATECTVGRITQIVVYSELFPFDYDAAQFDLCLSVETLKENLEAITDKVYDPELQRIILNKLNQAYPDGLSDERLQVLGSSSRAATPSDVTRWNVTKIDTLSSLMASGNGEWDPEMVRLIVSKYLSVSGNRLGSSELNSLGSNICALNTSVLNNITAASIEKATALPLTNCTSEQKRIVFGIAQSAFSKTNTRGPDSVSPSTYQLMQSYLGGADNTFVRKLVNSNINMDLITFVSLEQSVINVLNVMDVKSLLGVNVGDLKTYESASQIQEWIKLQLQTDLDTLKIDLTGGRIATVTISTTKAPSGPISTVTAAGGNTIAASTTKGAVSRVYAPVCLQLILLAVTVQLLH
ncbi:uncharacterized protein mslnb isoform X2 [Triplophysa dalaica]|uniref:uncharacterized protein mslnb isoform X2 n=1 Tax=Triplophysa dalaica TaxID=1582913 RepID=UPI0024DFF4B8|nr:uncharacterized protein mslnb isoform X2 [Triplophysa dalaica]